MPQLPAECPQGTRQLWQHQREVLRRVALGHSNVQIARDLSITPTTVSNIKNSDLGREHLERLNMAADDNVREIQSRIANLMPAALDVVEELIIDRAVSPGTRAKLAIDLLDRGGVVAPSRTVVEHRHFGKEDLERIKAQALRSGQIVDVEPEGEEPPQLEASGDA